MKIWYHGKNDWCHFCGSRKYPTADIIYSKDAEHQKTENAYERICLNCASRIVKVLNEVN